MKNVRLYIFLYFTAAMALDVVYRSLDHVTRAQPAEWAQVFIEQATGYYGAMLLLPAVFWVARRWPVRLSLARIGVHLVTVALFSIVHTSLLWASRTVLFPLFGLGSYDYGAMPVRYLMEFPSDMIGYAMWVTAFTVYRNWLSTKDLETQLVSARLENLSHQLQPHFLFNALNAVSATMYEDLGRADRMLERICDFLRATLRLPDSPMVPVATELALARQYLEVMKARLEDRLQFEIHCDPRAEASRVPALLLQPLVENAVEHGQDPASGCLNIAIDVQHVVRHTGNFIEITIRDHGPGFSSDGAGNGLGMARGSEELLQSRDRQGAVVNSRTPPASARDSEEPIPNRDRQAPADRSQPTPQRAMGAVVKSYAGLLTSEASARAKPGDDPSGHGISGHGISNAQRRLQTVYGDRATLRLNAHPEGGAVVEIQIPA